MAQAKKKPYLDGLTTLTGIPITDAIAMLDLPLPAQAYKKIGGGKGQTLGLTDIKPEYLPPKFTEIFGPPGIGWWFNQSNLSYETVKKIKKGQNNKPDQEMTDYIANCLVTLQFAYLDKDGNMCQSNPITVAGASDNSEVSWACKGAATNALGSAAYFLNYQTSVYFGERSHTNPFGGYNPDGIRPVRGKDGETPKTQSEQVTGHSPYPEGDPRDEEPPPPPKTIEAAKIAEDCPYPELVKLLESCETVKGEGNASLFAVWKAIRGSDKDPSAIWENLSEKEQKELDILKDQMKTKLT